MSPRDPHAWTAHTDAETAHRHTVAAGLADHDGGDL